MSLARRLQKYCTYFQFSAVRSSRQQSRRETMNIHLANKAAAARSVALRGLAARTSCTSHSPSLLVHNKTGLSSRPHPRSKQQDPRSDGTLSSSQWAFAGVVAASCCEQHRRQYHSTATARMEAEKGDKDEKTQKKDDDSFDIRELWRKHAQDSPLDNPREFWNKVISNDDDAAAKTQENSKTQSDKAKEGGNGIFSKVLSMVGFTKSKESEHPPNGTSSEKSSSSFETISKDFLKILSGKDESKGGTITEIVASVRNRSEKDGGDVEETTSLTEIFDMLQSYTKSLDDVARKFLGDIDFSQITPTALMYFVEHEDEVKNPSWKRRKHRFCPGIDASKADELYDSLLLADLAYADTVQEIQEGLENHATPHELIKCLVSSRPGQPAHFLAMQRNQPNSFFDSSLCVTLVVRGTKSVADALTDLLCEEIEYQGGKAHSFIVESGKWVVKQNHDLLLELLESSGKSQIKLKIVGHSLGAGAASIAGMELNAMNDKRIQAEVVGFGCPALVSKDLAEKSDFITTVINDDDVVPRLSGIAVANHLLDVLEFDWLPYAKSDIRSALKELQAFQPYLFSDDVTNKILETVEPMMEKHLRSTILPRTTKRLEAELFPPGDCIHYYRDGVGFSACYVPNTFFSEIDITRRMLHDHLFHSGYLKTLLDVERQRTGDHNFNFEKSRQ